jgi:hypothetical protein
MSTYRAWYLSLAAFLLVANPWAARAQTEAPLKMIYAVWKDSTGAATTLKQMSKGTKDLIEATAIITKDKSGNVQLSKRYNKAGGSVTALQASQLVDTAVARLSEPAPSASDSASGYAPAPRRLSEEDLKKITGMLRPGGSALILISPEPNMSEIHRSLGMGGQGKPEIVELEVKQ